MTGAQRPEGLPYDVWFRLARRRLPLAAEVPASESSRRAWVHVRPAQDSRYRIWYFEVESDRYAEVFDTWDYDKPGLLLNQQHATVSDESQLAAVLGRWLNDLSKLSDPGVTSYPI